RSALITDRLEQIQMLSPVNHSLGGVDPAEARSWLAAHVVIATMITANARTTANLNPRLSGACAICSPSWQQTEIGRLWLAARYPDRKHRAVASLGRQGQVAAHHARELAGDGEAETGAAEALRGRGLGLAECLEQLCLLLRRHANAGIDHRQLDPI